MWTRWAAIGAAVAVTLGAGGVSLGHAAIGSGDKPVFVAIEPCRLVDTRPGAVNIGGRTTPLGADDTLTLQITGSTGQCAGIPAAATAAAMNVTAIQGSTRSYLSVYPADAALPNASNLNWNGGDPPTPNKVDVALSPTGAVKITNDAGTVHVAADLVGYYLDHHHDDRYYTKNQADGRYYSKADADVRFDGQLEVYTGQLSVRYPANSAFTLVGDSYPRPLAAGTPIITQERITPPAFSSDCPGLGEAATPGVLCLYEHNTSNIGAVLLTNVVADSHLYGFSLEVYPASAGNAGHYLATWALPVPEG